MKKLKIVSVLLCLCMIFAPTVIFAEESVDAAVEALLKEDAQIKALHEKNYCLNQQIAATKAEIEDNEKAIKNLDQELSANQDRMAQQIRAMAIFTAEDYLELLFSSENFTEFITNADKVAFILKSNLTVLDQLKTLKKTIEEKRAANDRKLNQISLEQQAVEANIAQVNTLITGQNERLKDAQVAEAYANAQAEQAQQTQPTTSETQSEPTPTGDSDPQPSVSTSDFDLICAVVRHEAGPSYEGALAVMSCVMNRCDVGWGGTDPVNVLTAPGQFASYYGGYYQQFMGAAIPETRQAVIDCMENGIRSHGYLSFRGGYIEGALEICGNYYF